MNYSALIDETLPEDQNLTASIGTEGSSSITLSINSALFQHSHLQLIPNSSEEKMSPKNTISKALPASMEAESKPDASETDTRVSEKPRDKKPAAKQTQPRPKQPENEPEISEYETTSESDSENKNRQSNPTRKPKTKKLAAQPRAEDAVEEDADGSARQDVVEHTKVAKKPRSKQKSSKRRKSLGKERHGFNECAVCFAHPLCSYVLI